MHYPLRTRGGGDISALFDLTISVFSATWWVTMAVIAAIIVLIWVFRANVEPRKINKDDRKFLAWLSAITVCYLAGYKTLLAFSPYFDFHIWNELPLQPCNIVAVLAIPAALREDGFGRLLKSFCFYGGIVFAPVALMMPVEGFSGVPLFSVNALGFYGFHGLVLAISFSFGTLKLYKPRYRDIPGVLLVLSVLAFLAYVVNMILRATVYPDANYFYTYGLEGNPVLENLRELIPVDFLYELPLLLVMTVLCMVITFLFNGIHRLLNLRKRGEINN